MKALVLMCALLLPAAGMAATLRGAVTDSTASVDLASVGTLDWARWPGYKHKAGLISDLIVTGTPKSYTNTTRIIGDGSGVKVGGVGAELEIRVPATNTERTLRYYIGGWNSTAKLTVTLPNATTYTATMSSAGTYSKVVTIKFTADTASGAVLRVRFTQTANNVGSINVQAAALQAAATTSGSANLKWSAPTTNTNGTPLTDLAGYKIYWGKTQGQYTNSAKVGSSTLGYKVTGLSAGRWYFAVTALSASGAEGPPSNAISKDIK